MKDPLEQADVKLAPPWVWIVGFFGLGAIYAVLFPKMFATVLFILTLPVIIFLHELGHFITAKRAGMKVTEFFVGFGPRVWSFRRGETEYGLKAIPLGGYCRIIGMTNLEEVAPEDEPRAYRSKRFLPKVIVAGAGSAVHFMIALVLMFAVLWLHGGPREVNTMLAEISEDSGAAAAGLQPGDRVVAVNDIPMDDYEDLYEYLGSRSDGETVTFDIERDGEMRAVDVTLEETTDNGVTRVRAGIMPEDYVPELSLGEAVVDAPKEVWNIGAASVSALGDMFSPSGIANYFGVLSGDENADENQRFLSPVGFGRAGSQAVNEGWVAAVFLLILMNVFIGLFNLVPLLPFDGGHIAIATYERIASWIRRRPVRADAAKLLPVTAFVVVVLGFIFVSSLFLDIANPADNPF